MDSVIAKLDGSVFGMLIDQAPRILICGVGSEEDAVFVNNVRPDFVCARDDDLRKKLNPVIRVLDSPDDLPVISRTDDTRALNVAAGFDQQDTMKMIKKTRPDTVMIELEKHDEDEYNRIRKLIRVVRSMQPEMTD